MRKLITCGSSANESQTVGTSVASSGAPSIAPRIAPFNFELNRETVPD